MSTPRCSQAAARPTLLSSVSASIAKMRVPGARSPSPRRRPTTQTPRPATARWQRKAMVGSFCGETSATRQAARELLRACAWDYAAALERHHRETSARKAFGFLERRCRCERVQDALGVGQARATELLEAAAWDPEVVIQDRRATAAPGPKKVLLGAGGGGGLPVRRRGLGQARTGDESEGDEASSQSETSSTSSSDDSEDATCTTRASAQRGVAPSGAWSSSPGGASSARDCASSPRGGAGDGSWSSSGASGFGSSSAWPSPWEGAGSASPADRPRGGSSPGSVSGFASSPGGGRIPGFASNVCCSGGWPSQWPQDTYEEPSKQTAWASQPLAPHQHRPREQQLTGERRCSDSAAGNGGMGRSDEIDRPGVLQQQRMPKDWQNSATQGSCYQSSRAEPAQRSSFFF